MTRMNLETFAARFVNGDFENPDVHTQLEAGWYDWFCRDTSLANKTKALGKKVLQLMKSSKINTGTSYVMFKNNCPMVGNLYDDFRICDMETGKVLYTVTPSSGHKSDKGIAEVWCFENNFSGPIVSGTWNDVKTFFGVK